MISEEGKIYMEQARPLWDYGEQYIAFKANGRPINSPLGRLRLGEDLRIYVPHLAAYLFYFTEMAKAPHDYTMSFIGTETTDVEKLTNTGQEMYRSYGVIRTLYEKPELSTILGDMSPMKRVLFLLTTFPEMSDFTHTTIPAQFEDIHAFFSYIDELMAYFNQQQLEEYHQRQKEQAPQNPQPKLPPRTEEEQKMISATLDFLKENAEAQGASTIPTEKDAAALVKKVRGAVEKIGSHKPPPEQACFVATAVYQHSKHPQVNALRHWRDHTLRQSSAGRTFIRWYYRRGPGLARVVETVPWLRKPVRWVLNWWIKMIYR
jgi:hypothetical protein